MVRIELGDLDDGRVVALLAHHVATATAQTAPGSAHALDVEKLRSPAITLWAAFDEGGGLVGVAALKELSGGHGEVKSMHTAEGARRRGVGGALLRHVIRVAAERGIRRLSLETGSSDYFAPARAFYRRHGFVECEPFEGYLKDPNSVFFTMELARS